MHGCFGPRDNTALTETGKNGLHDRGGVLRVFQKTHAPCRTCYAAVEDARRFVTKCTPQCLSNSVACHYARPRVANKPEEQQKGPRGGSLRGSKEPSSPKAGGRESKVGRRPDEGGADGVMERFGSAEEKEGGQKLVVSLAYLTVPNSGRPRVESARA